VQNGVGLLSVEVSISLDLANIPLNERQDAREISRSQKPEVRNQKPEAGSQKPKVRSGKSEAKSQKREVRSQKPEAGRHKF
jgi:hypothetical protein